MRRRDGTKGEGVRTVREEGRERPENSGRKGGHAGQEKSKGIEGNAREGEGRGRGQTLFVSQFKMDVSLGLKCS